MYKYLDALEENKRKLFENNNPYEIGERIWTIIQSNFAAYKVQVAQSFPTKPVTQNIISWRILQRTPGTGQNNQFQSTGKQSSAYLGTTSDGLYLEEKTQTFQIDLQYGVFGNSSIEVNKIAWDLEQAVLNSKYFLQGDDSQIQVKFLRQSATDNFQIENQDEIITQYLVFRVVLPARFIDAKPEIRQFDLVFRDKLQWHAFIQERGSSSDTFIANMNNLPIEAITQVSIYRNSNWIKLKEKVDFTLARKTNSNDIVLTWLSTGLNPTVGETFKVECTYYAQNMHVLLDKTE